MRMWGMPLTRRQGLLAALGAAVPQARAEANLEKLAALTQGPAAPLSGLVLRLQRGPQVLAEGAWGWRRLGARPLPMQRDTRLRIASISKLALALALLRLHEAGKLDLDADLSRWLGTPLRHPLHREVPISARLLLTHRSSLQDPDQPTQPDGAALRRSWADPAHWHPAAPGTRFAYCNFAFALLATAMEAACGERFDALMQRWLFGPLGIRPGYDVALLPPAERPHLATLYRRGPQGWEPQTDAWPLPTQPRWAPGQQPGQNGSSFAPQGGLRISLPELARIATLLQQRGQWQGRTLISPAGFDSLLQPSWVHRAGDGADTLGGLFRAWGLGLQIFADVHDAEGGDRLHPRGGWRAYGHLGEAYGLLSGLLFQPADAQQPGWSLLYAFNGTLAQPERGRHSSLSRCEERVLETLLDLL